MKGRRAATAALIGGAAAQSLSVTTVTLDCPTSSMVPLVTVTSGVTFTTTYCPDCLAPTAPVYAGPGYTTTYTTVFQTICSTGLVPVTHTITESCTGPTPTFTLGPSYIPPGFTVITKPCTGCGEATPTVTLTEPCGCSASNGVVITPKPSSGSPAPGSPPAYAPGSGSPPSYAPGAGSPAGPPAGSPPGSPPSYTSPPACTGAKCGATDNPGSGSPVPPPAGKPGSPVPYPAPVPSSSACNGANCGATDNTGVTQIPDGQIQVPTGAMPSKPTASPPSGGDAPITPVTGGGSIQFISSVVAALSIGALALAL